MAWEASRRTLVPLIVVASLVAGCSLHPRSAPAAAAVAEGIPADQVVDLGDAAVGVRAEDGGAVFLVHPDIEGAWQVTQVGSTGTTGGRNTSRVTSGTGLGLRWNTFVYGTAAPGVEFVGVEPLTDPRGGQVVRGMWVVASPEENVGPEEILVTYYDAVGDPVATD